MCVLLDILLESEFKQSLHVSPHGNLSCIAIELWTNRTEKETTQKQWHFDAPPMPLQEAEVISKNNDWIWRFDLKQKPQRWLRSISNDLIYFQLTVLTK